LYGHSSTGATVLLSEARSIFPGVGGAFSKIPVTTSDAGGHLLMRFGDRVTQYDKVLKVMGTVGERC